MPDRGMDKGLFNDASITLEHPVVFEATGITDAASLLALGPVTLCLVDRVGVTARSQHEPIHWGCHGEEHWLPGLHKADCQLLVASTMVPCRRLCRL